MSVIEAVNNAISLRFLNAHFVGRWHDDRAAGGSAGYTYLPTIEGAQGLNFQCPVCAVGKEYGEELDEIMGCNLGFAKGAHRVICWFRNPRGAEPVPASAEPGPGRWWVESGDWINNITFGHGDPPIPKSIKLEGGCNWHGFIVNGAATLS